MKRLVAMFVLFVAAAQSLCTYSQDGKGVSQIEIPSDAIGHVCELVLKSGSDSSTETDVGKVVRFDDSEVVLTDATRTVRVETTVPVLGAIPYLGSLFRRAGTSVEQIPGELTINRSEISSIEFDR